MHVILGNDMYRVLQLVLEHVDYRLCHEKSKVSLILPHVCVARLISTVIVFSC